MIRTHVQELARSRGIGTAYQLAEKTGLKFSAAYRLWGDGFLRIDKTTLNKLCTVLRTTPGKLITFEKDAE